MNLILLIALLLPGLEPAPIPYGEPPTIEATIRIYPRPQTFIQWETSNVVTVGAVGQGGFGVIFQPHGGSLEQAIGQWTDNAHCVLAGYNLPDDLSKKIYWVACGIQLGDDPGGMGSITLTVPPGVDIMTITEQGYVIDRSSPSGWVYEDRPSTWMLGPRPSRVVSQVFLPGAST